MSQHSTQQIDGCGALSYELPPDPELLPEFPGRG
jgi:hypothetical protein